MTVAKSGDKNPEWSSLHALFHVITFFWDPIQSTFFFPEMWSCSWFTFQDLHFLGKCLPQGFPLHGLPATARRPPDATDRSLRSQRETWQTTAEVTRDGWSPLVLPVGLNPEFSPNGFQKDARKSRILFIKTTEALDCFGKKMKNGHVSHQNKGCLIYVGKHMGLSYAVFSWGSENCRL